MSISVICRACKAPFTVKDDRAGRIVECPECGKDVRVADDDKANTRRNSPPPPPPRKPPVEASKTEWSMHSRRDAAEEVPKRNSKLPMVLLILGGVVIVGCGACGGLGYYFYGKVRSLDDTRNEKVTAANVDKLTAGMAARDVELILGPGKKLTMSEFQEMTTDGSNLTLNSINEQHRKYWTAWVEKGLVYRWRNRNAYVLVAFNDGPQNMGTLKGLSYQVPDGAPNSTIHNERIPLPRNPSADPDAVRHGIAKRPDGAPPTPKTPSNPKNDPKQAGLDKSSAIRVSVSEVLANPKNYVRKWLIVTGKVADVNLVPGESGAYLLTEDGKPNEEVYLRCMFGSTFNQYLIAAKGDTVDVTGRWYRGEPGESVEMLDCELSIKQRNVQTVFASDIARDYYRDEKAADAKYRGKTFRIQGTVLDTKPLVPGDGITLRGFTDSKRKVMTKVSAPCTPSWKSRFEAKQSGSQVVLCGEVIAFSDGAVKLGDCWLLTR